MKILNNNINFGYNKEYHDKVNQYLSIRKQSQNVALSLLEADRFTLQLEDTIAEMEKAKKTKTLGYKNISDLLTETKETIALYFETCFPNLEYAKNISKQYEKEANEIKDPFATNWRRKICEKLQGFVVTTRPDIYETRELDTKQESTAQETKPTDSEIKKTIDEIRAQAMDDYDNAKANEVLELFRPNASSPRGFVDVIGMDDIKERFQDEILAYIKNPELKEIDEKEYGIRAPRGYLFYGPPGCGKTFIVQALAQESGLLMYKMDIAKLGSKFINQTSGNIQKGFDFIAAQNAKNNTQSLLFMDEVDGLALGRGQMSSGNEDTVKVTSTLLKLIEEAREKGIIVIAATNKYDILDEAFKARFDGQMYFGLPDEEQIKKLLIGSLSKRTKGLELAKNNEAIESLIKDLKGYSNRSIVFIVDEAAKLAKRRNRSNITEADLREAIEKSELEKPKDKDYHKKSKQRKVGFGSF